LEISSSVARSSLPLGEERCRCEFLGLFFGRAFSVLKHTERPRKFEQSAEADGYKQIDTNKRRRDTQPDSQKEKRRYTEADEQSASQSGWMDSQTQRDTQGQTDSQPASKTDTKTDSQPAAKSDATPDGQPGSHTASKIEIDRHKDAEYHK
jgi:hypothetical protein